jgi:hypothetical protein
LGLKHNFKVKFLYPKASCANPSYPESEPKEATKQPILASNMGKLGMNNVK